MSTEIQTSLLILTAEIAAVSTVAALLAAGLAWLRGRARLKAAQALRDAAARLPGEGEVVKLERELLGEFARAYLTRDAELLAGLPARLLSLRQAIEAAVVPPEPEADPAQAQALLALEAERAALQAKVEGVERQQEQLRQQLDTALATINTLVQEYGRGRGMAVTPTAEALLQALAQAGGVGAAAVAVPAQAAAEAERPSGVTGTGPKLDAEETMLDLALEEPVAVDRDASGSVSAETAAASFLDLAEDGAGAHAGRDASPVAFDDLALDLSVPIEPSPSSVQEAEQGREPPMGEGRDEIEALDIDALLDAELGRQAQLLAADGMGEDELYDLARLDGLDAKK